MKLRQPLSNQKGANSFRQDISKAYKMREKVFPALILGEPGFSFYGICAAGFIWRSIGAAKAA